MNSRGTSVGLLDHAVPADFALEREILGDLVRERAGRAVDLECLDVAPIGRKPALSRRYSRRSAAESTSVIGTLPATARAQAAAFVPSSQV